MKRVIVILSVFCVMISGSACSSLLGFGTFYETSPERYGKWDTYLNVPSFLPESVENFTVNSYSYTLYSYMDVCYEIFLDVSVGEAEFAGLLDSARAYSDCYVEKTADYCAGFTEIVFMDDYEQGEDSENVGWADIEKVIYNPDTYTIVYVVFHANDTGVYEVEDVAYFNRFSIIAREYSPYKMV